MTIISLKDAGFVAAAPLFRNLTLTLGAGDRLGLVAPNGAGKSTLLRCLAGTLELTGGDVVRARGCSVGHVPQQVEADLARLTFREAVLDALPAADRESEGWRVDMVLESLEAPADRRAACVAELSGGWQRLMLLARVWVTEPDLLLLDEPTNHLDLERMLRLEAWLAAWAADVAVVVASHDRGFLDAVTNRTLFLRPEKSHLFALPYSRARAELDRMDAAAADEQARDLKTAQRLRRQSAKLKNIGINSGSDLLQKKQKQLRARAERIEESAAQLHRERPGEIRLANRDTHAKRLVRIEDLAVATPDGRVLFRIAMLNIFKGDRLVLLGRNGTGKSTLVRLLRAALGGAEVPGIRATPSLVMGYLDQALSDLPPEKSAFQLISARGPDDARCRASLAAAGIAYDLQRRPLRQLSFGQRTRVALLALRFAAPNFYLLDEPTNHVDIPGQEALAEEIKARGACCLLVSHDRAFVRDVGTRFLVIEDGALEERDSPEDYFASLAP